MTSTRERVEKPFSWLVAFLSVTFSSTYGYEEMKMVVLLGIRLNSHVKLVVHPRLERDRNERILGQVLGGSGVVLVAGCGPFAGWLPADGCGLVAACGLVTSCLLAVGCGLALAGGLAATCEPATDCGVGPICELATD